MNVRRLTPGLAPFSGLGYDFWIIDLYRPLDSLLKALREWEPSILLTEWAPEITPALSTLPCPMVLVPADVPFEGAQRVDVDDAAVGRTAAEHLRSRGYRTYAFVGRGDAHYARQRLEGFEEAVGQAVPVFWEAFRDWRQYDEYWREPDEALLEWLAALPSPVGIFAAHDPTARHVLEAAAQIGREAPYSIGLVSANDDETVCAMARPAISSIRLPWRRLAADAMRAAEHLWNGHPAGPPFLSAPLEVSARGSTSFEAVDDALVRKALHHLQDHLSAQVTVASLAREIGTSRRVLERRFRDALDRSPLEVIQHERIERAKRLLAETDLSVALVAEHVGFQSNERLTVNFHRLVGMPPASFRRQARGST